MQPPLFARLCLCAALLASSWPLPLAAQQGNDEVTPEVQQLYANARQAQANNDAPRAIALYRQMLHLAPHLAPAYNNLGMLQYNGRDYAAAADTLRHGLALDPHMNTAQTLLGLSDFRLGHLDEARTELTAALAADPSSSDAALTLARIEITTGDAVAGTAALRAYLTRNPQDQQAWYLLGKTYLKLSEDSLTRINAIDPDSATAHEIAGEIDESMHNDDGALAEYTKAIQKAPHDPGTHYHLGNALWMQQKWQPAEAEFRAELLNDPGSCLAAWKLGNSILADNGTPEDALPSLNQALAHCPQLMQAHVDRANALLKQDLPKQALTDLLPAEKDSPAEPSIHFLLARAYKQLGDQAQNRAELETYSRLQRQASESVAQQAKDVLAAKGQTQ